MRYNTFIISISILISLGCTSQIGSDSEAEGGHDHGIAEIEGAVASLTDRQIEGIGMTFGVVEQKALTATLRVSGRLKVPNANKAVITALYGGVIRELNVDVGNKVRKGDVIATLVHPQFIQLQEEYITLTGQIGLAEMEWQRQQTLTDGKVGALKNLQRAEVDLEKLRTRQTSLREQLQLMGIDISAINPAHMKRELAVVSPVTGTVSDVFAKLGSFVDVATPMAEVVENNQIHLDLQVFEKDLPQLKVGQQIHFVLTNNPDRNYDADIFGIGAAFENDSKTIPVHCSVSGDKIGLIDGMSVSAIISLANKTTAAVPDEAIVDVAGKSYLFMVTDKEGGNHEHAPAEEHDHTEPDRSIITNFERVEIVKGTSELGYTSITPVRMIPKDAKIVTKGAFFINAVLSGTAGHSH